MSQNNGEAKDWMTRARYLERTSDFSVGYRVQTDGGARLGSYPVGNGLFPGVKRTAHEAEYSSLYCVAEEKECNYCS
jgi:hypothetical protein